jgi:hypothetical protein
MSQKLLPSAINVVCRAASIRLELENDVLAFSFVNNLGENWDGCIEEWIGNEPDPVSPEQLVVEFNGSRYYQIGASGGGADLVLVCDEDDASLYYLNNYDRTLSHLGTLDLFLSSLRAID